MTSSAAAPIEQQHLRDLRDKVRSLNSPFPTVASTRTSSAADPMQQQHPRHLQNNNHHGSNATLSAILDIVGHGIYTTSLAVNPTQHVRHKKVDGKLSAAHIVGLGNRLSILNFVIVR